MEGLLIFLAIVAVAIFAVIAIYNRLVALRQTRENAFADIDVQLNQRNDLIPNLVETVKGYAGHEKGVLENVTAARARAMAGGSVNDKVDANNQLSSALVQLMAVSENYPQLKADTNFLQLQKELSDIENKIAASRRFFNNATNEYNTAQQQFPAVIFASMLGFKNEAFFEIAADKKEQMQTPPSVKF